MTSLQARVQVHEKHLAPGRPQGILLAPESGVGLASARPASPDRERLGLLGPALDELEAEPAFHAQVTVTDVMVRR